MRNFKTAVVLAAAMFVLGACAPLIIGGASGGAVYSTTSDHIKDNFRISKEQAFEVLVGLITADDGKITVSSIAEGKIQARIGNSFLFVNIKPINDMTIEVSFRAKKHIEIIPDKDTAVRYYRSFVKAVMK